MNFVISLKKERQRPLIGTYITMDTCVDVALNAHSFVNLKYYFHMILFHHYLSIFYRGYRSEFMNLKFLGFYNSGIYIYYIYVCGLHLYHLTCKISSNYFKLVRWVRSWIGNIHVRGSTPGDVDYTS